MERLKIKKKICFVIASRANYGRLKSVIIKFKKKKKFTVQVVLAASALLERYGDLKEILKKVTEEKHISEYKPEVKISEDQYSNDE